MTEQRHNELGIHPLDPGDGSSLENLPRRGQIVRRTRILTWIVLLVLAIGAGRTIVSRIFNARSLEAGTEQRATTYVTTAVATVGTRGQELTLPGTLQGYVQAPISARASGYLKNWTKDIGSPVKKGDLLADIETPEIDQQLSQAVASRQQAASALDLARSTLTRWESLRKKDVVSQQDLDERRGAELAARANLAAADANVQRLRQTEGFKHVIAPFDGIITRRNVDVGDLIDAGSGRPLFVMSQTDPLRVYVNVPQTYTQIIKAGEDVAVTESEMPGQSFPGKVARTAGSIDPASRTMQVEVALPNPDGVLLPGAYVQVVLKMPPSKALIIPANALLFRGEGTSVAVVDAQGKIALHDVTLGRNLGRSYEVKAGLAANDHFVINPADSLSNGDKVAVRNNGVAVAQNPPTPAGSNAAASGKPE